MARHVFNFPNGDILTIIGATWFVSYAYYIYTDGGHANWRKSSMHQSNEYIFKQQKTSPLLFIKNNRDE